MIKSTGEIIALTARKRTHPGLFALGGFIVGILVMLLWNIEGNLALLGVDTEPIHTASTTNGFPPNNLIKVSSQPSGASVSVASVNAVGAWAAVHELRGTTLGNVLGAARVLSESALSISLLRNTEPDKNYAIVQYRDDGDGEFTLGNDSVFVDYDTGERVVGPFSTTP